jgi:two-component sensor histidine kinase
MLLNELATNAVKYGSLSDPDGPGAVELTWTRHRAPANGPADGAPELFLRLEWVESGGPPVYAPTRRGLGLELIEGAASYELGGIARLDFRPEGLRCTVDIPLNAQNTRRGRFEQAVASTTPTDGAP